MIEKELRKVFSDIIIFSMGIVLAKLIQFLLLPLYTGNMSVEAFGTAELINNLTELFLPIVSLCIYDAVLRFTIEDNNRAVLISSAVKTTIISMLAFTIITLIINLVYRIPYLVEFLLILFSYTLQRLFSCYVRGQGHSKIYALSGVVNAIAVAVFSVLFIVVFNRGIRGYLQALALGFIFSAGYLCVANGIHKDISWKSASPKMSRDIFKFSWPLILHSIMYFFLTLFGRYALLWFQGNVEVGLYSAAIKISAIINMLQQAVSMAIQLSVSKGYENERNGEVYSYIFNLFYAGYWIFASIIILMCPIISRITLKNDFVGASKYIPAIIFSAILNCISAMFGTMFQAYKKTRNNIPIVMTGMLINVFLCIKLVPLYGIWGVCISSIAAYLSQIIIKMWNITFFCDISYRKSVIILYPILVSIQVIINMRMQDLFWIQYIIVFVLVISFAYVYKYDIHKIVLKLGNEMNMLQGGVTITNGNKKDK